jgi:HPt (histidine-containing phosphotransfer) domain-containing protein
MLPSLIEGFFAEAPRLIAKAGCYLDEKQAADLMRAAHTLKSNSATFGAMALSASARELEVAAREDALQGAGELLRRIQTEFEQARLALQAWPGKTEE